MPESPSFAPRNLHLEPLVPGERIWLRRYPEGEWPITLHEELPNDLPERFRMASTASYTEGPETFLIALLQIALDANEALILPPTPSERGEGEPG